MSAPLLASRSQLRALHSEAGRAGDEAAVDLCELALSGDAAAWHRCTAIIVEALGNDDLGLKTVAAVADMLGLGCKRAGCEIIIVTDDWCIRVTMDDGQSSGSPGLCWVASDIAGKMSDESGGWDSLADIEATLRDLGGAQ